MLPLPSFEWLSPTTLDEVLLALADRPSETMLLAGGTDVVPNLKYGVHAPARIIGLRKVAELRTFDQATDGSFVIGAGVTLDRIATDSRVRARLPALAEAARSVASPQIRQMGTLGGNLCLDTRCGYYNQTEFWRGALGGCIKTGGPLCHVVPQGKRCVAAFSADTPLALLAYEATLDLVSTRGARSVTVASFFAGDGLANTVRARDEVLVRVRIPAPPPGMHSAYRKVRFRRAIDFPLLSIAAAAVLDAAGSVADLRVIVGALGALPRPIRGLTPPPGPLSLEAIDTIAATAAAQCHPLPSLDAPAWRRDIVAPTVRRILSELTASIA